jgi:uncharacterized membrane protein YhaH (DUF805 family)
LARAGYSRKSLDTFSRKKIMSKPVFQDLFKFSGRRNRKSYILLLLAQIGALIGLSIVGTVGAAMLASVDFLAYILLLAVLVGFVAVAWSGWASGSQRIRDFGYSGVWILLVFIPYVGWLVSLAIMFVPSSEGDNRYGSSYI